MYTAGLTYPLILLVEISRMTEVQSGENVKDQFQGLLKKHSLDCCIYIKFNDSETELKMVADSSEVASFWIRGLHVLIINKGMISCNLHNIGGKTY